MTLLKYLVWINSWLLLHAAQTCLVPLRNLARPFADITHASISSCLAPNFERTYEASESEQYPPVYLGMKPADRALGRKKTVMPRIPASLRQRGEVQGRAVLKHLGRDYAELEAWPTLNDQGEYTWVFARWRENPASPWHWLNSGQQPKRMPKGTPLPILPQTLDPSQEKDRQLLFSDFLLQPDLYTKPLYNNAVFTDNTGNHVIAAWPSTREGPITAANVDALKNTVAHVLPQPAQHGDQAISFLLRASGSKVFYPPDVRWQTLHSKPVEPIERPSVVKNWAPDFDDAYRRLIKDLSEKFPRQNSSQLPNDLEAKADYLERFYHEQGIKTVRLRFTWRGIPQSIVIGMIPGSLPAGKNRPVLLADHYDTAFAEDVFKKVNQRVAVPGANDNATATATLLMAAKHLKAGKNAHDIWLVNLPGEEYPADDLGIRWLVRNLLFLPPAKWESTDPETLAFLKAHYRSPWTGMFLLDMLGHHRRGDTKFQINPGEGTAAASLAGIAAGAAKDTAPSLQALVRPPHTPVSYLANTDGDVLDKIGIPVVFFNEPTNFTNYMAAKHYHESDDVIHHVDIPFSAKIARTAIESTARAASQP